MRFLQIPFNLIAPFLIGKANSSSIAAILINFTLSFLGALGIGIGFVLGSALAVSWFVPKNIANNTFIDIIGFGEWVRQTNIDVVVGTLALVSILVLAIRLQTREKNKRTAWVYIVACFSFLLITNAANVELSYLINKLTNAFTARDEAVAKDVLLGLALLISIWTPLTYVGTLLPVSFANFWRSVATQQYITAYLGNKSFYQISAGTTAGSVMIDNPDQRIAQDIDEFTQESTSLFFGLISGIISTTSFGIVLWNINPKAFIFGVAYAFIGTGLGAKIGKRLFRLNYKQLELNADFRYNIIQVKDNAESIAFYNGERFEALRLASTLRNAIYNKYKLIKETALFAAYQTAYGNIQSFVPYILLWAAFFGGDVEFGEIAQASMAFGVVMSTFSFFVDNFTVLANTASNAVRIDELSNSFIGEDKSEVKSHPQKDLIVSVNDATLFVPDSDRLLISKLSLDVGAQDRILIVGGSGTGKTSILRMLCGLWKPTSGSVRTKGIEEGILFVPQKPYLYKSNLKDLLLYPFKNNNVSVEQINHALERANLNSLLKRYPNINKVVDWQRVLSIGEQQRIAFARTILGKARFMLLDEATSALDSLNEQAIYQELTNMRVGYISVGHRSSLLKYHDKVLELQPGGGWRIVNANRYVFEGMNAEQQ